MVTQIKQFSNDTKRKFEQAFEAVAIVLTVLGCAKLATLPYEYNFPLWQITAGVIVSGILVKLYGLLVRE